MLEERKKQAERLQEAVAHLKSIGKIRFQKDLANFVNYNHQTINKMVKQAPTDEFLYDFAKTFNDIFNEEYIKLGTGTLLKENETSNNPNIDVEWLKKQLEIKDNTITILEKELAFKNKQLDEQLETIRLLRRMVDRPTETLSLGKKEAAV